MASNQFALLKIFVGIKDTSARPIAWQNNTPTIYVTTCTKCNQLVKFNVGTIKEKDGVKFIDCDKCKSTFLGNKSEDKIVYQLEDPIEIGRLKINGAKKIV